MGACDFFNIAKGATALEAFQFITEQARWEHGHGGYTGTIAEKHGFRMVAVPAGREPMEFAQDCLQSSDGFWDDKWGDAGCVDLKDGRFAFFGWASS